MLQKLKQFKDLRAQAKKIQGALSQESVTVREANDSIVLTMDGNLQISGLAIDDALLDPSKKEKLIEGIKKAHEEALKKMQRIMAVKMKEMGGLPDIPGLN